MKTKEKLKNDAYATYERRTTPKWEIKYVKVRKGELKWILIMPSWEFTQNYGKVLLVDKKETEK
jgi:hypothetical protein